MATSVKNECRSYKNSTRKQNSENPQPILRSVNDLSSKIKQGHCKKKKYKLMSIVNINGAKW